MSPMPLALEIAATRRHMSNLLRQIAHETDAMEIKLLRSLYDRADTKLAALARMQKAAE